MKPLPTEAPIVEYEIDHLDRILTSLHLTKPVITIGPGERRARERLAAQRREQAQRLVEAPKPEPTRQQRRQHAKLRAKQALTIAKAQALKERRNAAVLG